MESPTKRVLDGLLKKALYIVCVIGVILMLLTVLNLGVTGSYAIGRGDIGIGIDLICKAIVLYLGCAILCIPLNALEDEGFFESDIFGYKAKKETAKELTNAPLAHNNTF